MRNGFRNVKPLALMLSAALLALAGLRSQAAEPASEKSRKPSRSSRAAEAIPGEFVVKLKAPRGVIRTQAVVAAQHDAVKAAVRRLGVATVSGLQADNRFAKVVVRTRASRQQVIRQLEASPDVQYAEPNYVYRIIGNVPAVQPAATQNKGWWDDDGGWWDGGNGGWWGNQPGSPPNDGFFGDTRTPNDTHFGQLWGMMNSGQADPSGQSGTAGVDIGATRAWALATGTRDVVVAIIDTGIDGSHEDLAANMYTNPGEIADNGIDDDANGFIDDVRGWNFSGQNNNAFDDNRHGTHCAGTIGGVGDNGIGVTGVNWQVRLMPIKFLSAEGSGSLADALESIRYATKMRVNVMSNSWGGGGHSVAMEEAIREARDNGILFIAAAGNESNNNDRRPTYPAGYTVENVIAVAAIDNRDRTASWSNYGQRTVHLGAPGVNIYSTTPGNQYESLSGTSMACPHVAGAAALVWSANTSMTYADVKQRLMATVEPTSVLTRKTISGGRLNIHNALTGRVPERAAVPSEDAWVGSAYSVESSHDYVDNANEMFSVQVPNARFIRVHFSRVAMEDGYDILRVLDRNGEEVDMLTGSMDDYTSAYVDGDTLQLNMVTDGSITSWGFAVDRVDYIY